MHIYLLQLLSILFIPGAQFTISTLYLVVLEIRVTDNDQHQSILSNAGSRHTVFHSYTHHLLSFSKLLLRLPDFLSMVKSFCWMMGAEIGSIDSRPGRAKKNHVSTSDSCALTCLSSYDEFFIDHVLMVAWDWILRIGSCHSASHLEFSSRFSTLTHHGG